MTMQITNSVVSVYLYCVCFKRLSPEQSCLKIMTFYYSKSNHCLTDTIHVHFALIANLLGLVAVVLFCFSLVVVYSMKVSFVPKLLSVFWNNITPTWTNRAAINSSTYTEWQIARDRAVVNLQVCCWKPKQRSLAKIYLFLRNFITWY